MNFFVSKNQIKDNNIYISGSDFNHIKNVLRYKEGDLLNVVDKDTSMKYKAKIISEMDNEIKCNIIEKIDSVENNLKVDIYQALPKADKMELIIQKCSEIGANKIVPVSMKRCVVRLDEKDALKKVERWRKISEVAAKQSLRTDIMQIENVTNIENVCQNVSEYDIVLIAYEKEENSYLKEEINKLKTLDKDEIKIAFIVGPEGGFEEEEVNKLISCGAKSISLGNRILRTETAPMVVLSILMYEMGDIGGNNGRN